MFVSCFLLCVGFFWVGGGLPDEKSVAGLRTFTFFALKLANCRGGALISRLLLVSRFSIALKGQSRAFIVPFC